MKKVFENISIFELKVIVSEMNKSKKRASVSRWYYDSDKQEGVTIQNI